MGGHRPPRPVPNQLRLHRRRYPDGTTLKLCRLRWGGVLHTWGFAIYRASHDDYEDSYLPSTLTAGSAEEALDCACGLYLNDPSAWTPNTPTN